MTIAHSVMSISFGRNRSRSSAAESVQRPAETSTFQSAHGMTCSPWEGLYFPAQEPESSQEAEVFNEELERFLLSLMSGE